MDYLSEESPQMLLHAILHPMPDIPENAAQEEIVTLSNHLLTSTKTKNQMKSALLLDVVIAQRTSILQLLTSKDQSLLVGWDTLLILDLGLDIINRIRGFNFQCNCLSSQGLDKDLHTTT